MYHSFKILLIAFLIHSTALDCCLERYAQCLIESCPESCVAKCCLATMRCCCGQECRDWCRFNIRNPARELCICKKKDCCCIGQSDASQPKLNAVLPNPGNPPIENVVMNR